MGQETINEYLSSVSNKLSERVVVNRPFDAISNFPLSKGQSFYIVDFKEKKISYQKGIEEMLGYSPDEFTFELTTNFFHPDDYDIVTRLIKSTLQFATENNVTKHVAFFLTYRIKHKNGSFLKVLRQTNIYEGDVNGSIISNLSLLTDISFINKSDKVEWSFDAPGLDKEMFKDYVRKGYSDFFSEREFDIIKKLQQGLKSDAIAKGLFISKHTVDTHRRNILRKANCKNTIELLNFCNQHGVL